MSEPTTPSKSGVTLKVRKKMKKPPQPRVSRSQGSTPSRNLSTAFTLSPPMHGSKRNSPISSRKKKRSTIQRANSTIERILQYQELGKDVPTDIAIKRVLILAQRGDWAGCEQALRAVEKADQAEQLPLANLVDPASGNTPLMYAAMENKISLMERMIALGCSLKRENSENYSVLHLACMYGRLETIQFVITHQSSPNLLGKAGAKEQTCLHLLASRWKTHQLTEMVGFLLKHSDQRSRLQLQTDQEGNIPMMNAIESNDVNLCHELLKELADEQMKATKPPLRDSLLHLCTRRRSKGLTKVFIEAGCAVDKVNAEGQTPLHLAALNGDLEALKLFYMARADPSIADVLDRTPIYLAAERGHSLCVDFLADKFKASVFSRAKDGSTLLHVAAQHGHSETAMILHKRGVPLLMPNSNGARGIHVAAVKGHVGVINAIIARGEDVNVLTNNDYTPLHLAIDAGQHEAVECLLGHGASVNILGGELKESPLHMACRMGEARGEKCVGMLLKSGSNPNLPMRDGRRSLHIAAYSGNARNVRLLLENGGDVALADGNGETALHLAVKGCHLKTLKVIIGFINGLLNDCTSFVTQENQKGETPLHLAGNINKGQLHFPSEDVDITKLLLDNGGSKSILRMTKTTKETVFHYVCTNGNNEILYTILKNIDVGHAQIGVNLQSAIGWSPLCAASAHGKVKCVESILENNGRVDVFDHEGKSSLHLASEFGSEEACRVLLTANAFINSKTKAGWTALHFAAQRGHTKLVEYFVSKMGATIDSTTMKKQTPLHLAATYGRVPACQILVDLGASLDAADDNSQRAIHLAALADQAEVILLLLKARHSLVSAATKDGNTCAHIAARKGSAQVVAELMKFDKAVVLTSRNKITESTTLHIAAEGGHRDLVKILLEAGASVSDETKKGHTPLHIAAQNGHVHVINEFAKHNVNLRMLSRRSGMGASHLAALYGEVEALRELLTHIPSHLKSELPGDAVSSSVVQEFATEYDLTPIHMASYSGSDDVVRALLNSAGTLVDAVSSPSGFTPLHLACMGGHIGVVGLLLSRTASLLKVVDKEGRTCLHISANRGHHDMVQVLLGQGAELNAKDKNGWVALHWAAHSGFLDIVKLLVETGSSTLLETLEGKIPLWYAANARNYHVTTFLLRKPHNPATLLNDRLFCHNLMQMGKKQNNKSIEDFIFLSPAPCYTAATLSAVFRQSALKEKDRAADFLEMGNVCEEMNKDLVALAANLETPGTILNSLSDSGVSFIDSLIEKEQKIAISQYVVQQYLQEIWKGHLQLKGWQFLLLFTTFLLVPPLWFMFSIPIDKGLNKVPVIKFMSYLTSHLYFMAFLTLLCVAPPDKATERETLFPFWYEIVVWVFYLGLLLSQITNPGAKGGLSWAKYVLVFLGLCSYVTHGVAVALDSELIASAIYIRNIFYGASLLLATILILDYLSFHPLFGPWAIIIGELLLDVMKFVVVLSLFMFGFALFFTSLNQPTEQEGVNPLLMFELLFFSMFGYAKAEDLIKSSQIEAWTTNLFKLIFASYLLLAVIVLINLLIAMMSDTYQRIQQQSDIEWKYGLAKLIRNMQRTQVAPSPLNLFSTIFVLIHQRCRKGKDTKKIARKKFREAMEDALKSKAPGMKFGVDITEKPRPLPTVIHALGNIKWGFSDGLKPLPIDKVQSKWDLDHARQQRDFGESNMKTSEPEPTSKAIAWPKVVRNYLAQRGRENELKEVTEVEPSVVHIFKSLVNIRNDASIDAQAQKWSKLPSQTKKSILDKWEQKASTTPDDK